MSLSHVAIIASLNTTITCYCYCKSKCCYKSNQCLYCQSILLQVPTLYVLLMLNIACKLPSFAQHIITCKSHHHHSKVCGQQLVTFNVLSNSYFLDLNTHFLQGDNEFGMEFFFILYVFCFLFPTNIILQLQSLIEFFFNCFIFIEKKIVSNCHISITSMSFIWDFVL